MNWLKNLDYYLKWRLFLFFFFIFITFCFKYLFESYSMDAKYNEPTVGLPRLAAQMNRTSSTHVWGERWKSCKNKFFESEIAIFCLKKLTNHNRLIPHKVRASLHGGPSRAPRTPNTIHQVEPNFVYLAKLKKFKITFIEKYF